MARHKTNPLPRTEQLKINQKKSQQVKKDKGDVRFEIWLPEALRDKLTIEAKSKGVSRSEYVLSLIEALQK